MSEAQKLASDWTAGDNDRQHELPGGQWVAFREDVSYGDQMKLDVACKGIEDEVAFAKRLAFHITRWSLTYPDGRGLPIAEESIHAMGMRKVTLLLKALERHNAGIREEYADPLSDAASSSASPSAG